MHKKNIDEIRRRSIDQEKITEFENQYLVTESINCLKNIQNKIIPPPKTPFQKARTNLTTAVQKKRDFARNIKSASYQLDSMNKRNSASVISQKILSQIKSDEQSPKSQNIVDIQLNMVKDMYN